MLFKTKLNRLSLYIKHCQSLTAIVYTEMSIISQSLCVVHIVFLLRTTFSFAGTGESLDERQSQSLAEAEVNERGEVPHGVRTDRPKRR